VRVSAREQQVIDLLLRGYQDSAIAQELGIARRTVKLNMNNLFRKFAIWDGVKRVKLAVLLSQQQLYSAQAAAGLSEAECRLVQMLTDGLTNLDIAKALGTSEQVVKNKLRVVYDKVGLGSRLELALWYVTRQREGASREPSAFALVRRATDPAA